MMIRLSRLLAILTAFTLTSVYAVEPQAQQLFTQLQDYMESAPFADGVITAEQLKALSEKPLIVDTRLEEHFSEQHIPNAIHIDWRFVLSELKQLPKDKLIVLYCDTGILSSKAQFALRLVGYEQVKVLFNGYQGWKAVYKP